MLSDQQDALSKTIWHYTSYKSLLLTRLYSVNGSWMICEYTGLLDDRRKTKCVEKSLCQCHFVHYKSHMDWPGIKPKALGVSQTANCLSHDMVSCCTEHRNIVYKCHLHGINTGKRKREREFSPYSKIVMFWDVWLCSSILRYQQFEINLLPLWTKEWAKQGKWEEE